jgi:hypothetical protein
MLLTLALDHIFSLKSFFEHFYSYMMPTWGGHFIITFPYIDVFYHSFVHPLYYSHYSHLLLPFFKWLQQIFMLHICTRIESISTILTNLYSPEVSFCLEYTLLRRNQVKKQFFNLWSCGSLTFSISCTLKHIKIVPVFFVFYYRFLDFMNEHFSHVAWIFHRSFHEFIGYFSNFPYNKKKW